MPLNNVPQAGQNLANTRDPIRSNFSVISNTFLVDHVDYNLTNAGKHNKVTFPLNPGATFLVNEMGLFNQNAAPTNRPDIWMARGATTAFPITGYDISGTQGWTYLPSGLKMIWGRNTITTAGSIKTIVFNTPGSGGIASFPGFTTVVGSVQLTRIDPNPATSFIIFIDNTLTQFRCRASSSSSVNTDFLWMAIGL